MTSLIVEYTPLGRPNPYLEYAVARATRVLDEILPPFEVQLRNGSNEVYVVISERRQGASNFLDIRKGPHYTEIHTSVAREFLKTLPEAGIRQLVVNCAERAMEQLVSEAGGPLANGLFPRVALMEGLEKDWPGGLWFDGPICFTKDLRTRDQRYETLMSKLSGWTLEDADGELTRWYKPELNGELGMVFEFRGQSDPYVRTVRTKWGVSFACIKRRGESHDLTGRQVGELVVEDFMIALEQVSSKCETGPQPSRETVAAALRGS